MKPLSLKAERFVVAVRESNGAVQGFVQPALLNNRHNQTKCMCPVQHEPAEPQSRALRGRGAGIGRGCARLLAAGAAGKSATFKADACALRSMNPLSLKAERFVVAARESDGALQGFGQLAPLGGAPEDGPQWLELRSLIVDPEHR